MCCLDRDQQLVHRRLTLFLGGEAGLGLAAALLGLTQGTAALGAALQRAALDPEPLVAGFAPLRRRQADVGDVLPAAGALVAAVTDVAPHDVAPSSVPGRVLLGRRCGRGFFSPHW